MVHSSTSRATSASSGTSIAMSVKISDKSTTRLEPCVATTRLLLYPQESSILCLQYDSLDLERRFERHSEPVTIIAVDTAAGDDVVARVVSVDAGKTAIVWDPNTGEELSRYTSFEPITVAAWMKNGNLAFGDAMGNVILFDPLRLESISARTIFNPLTSLAPSPDCRSFALGYENGSILVAALTPSFTILHTLTTTSLAPSPITQLAWHASSSKQRSDMLATQTQDGDLRVWSVPKRLVEDDTARVVRILKRADSSRRGENWCGWSRNGRIVQYSDGVTTIWDVRTKKISWEDVPTPNNVTGITVCGPKGMLFTLGRDHTVQQFALYPPQIVANVQHLPMVPPPSPPISIEEAAAQQEDDIIEDEEQEQEQDQSYIYETLHSAEPKEDDPPAPLPQAVYSPVEPLHPRHVYQQRPPPRAVTPPQAVTPPRRTLSPLQRPVTPPQRVLSPMQRTVTPPRRNRSPVERAVSPRAQITEQEVSGMSPLGRIAQSLERLEGRQPQQQPAEPPQIQQTPRRQPTPQQYLEQQQQIYQQQQASLPPQLQHQNQTQTNGLGLVGAPEGRSRAPSVSSRSSRGSNHERKPSTSSRPTPRTSESEPAIPTIPNGSSRKGSISSLERPNVERKGSLDSQRRPSIDRTLAISPPPPVPREPQSSPAPTRKHHPLRQEMHLSPEAEKMRSPVAEVRELFAGVRTRIATSTYDSPRLGGPSTGLSEDDLRKEMLFCIFGWKGDVEGLITDELESVNVRSLHALILRMWLGDIDQNSLAVLLGADFSVSGDWLFLALSAMGGEKSWHHVMRAYVMRLLQRNDVHVAVLCLLALGDKDGAVEVYVSQKRFLEAVLLTSLLWKKDWKRQSQLVRKWGEHASETHDGILAARCFACAGTEPASEPPQSRPPPPSRTPSRSHSRSHSRSRSHSESEHNFTRGLSISAPSNPRATLRMTPKNSPLKLITTFQPPPEPIQRSATTSPIVGVNRFFSGAGPRSATATPIAMSALTPIDPFWQNDPFPSAPSRNQASKLAPVTESSPLEKTPNTAHPSDGIQRLQPPEKDVDISSPIEDRNSGDYFGAKSPVTFGSRNASRTNSPAVPPPMPRKQSAPATLMAPAPPPPPTALPSPPFTPEASREMTRSASPRSIRGLAIQHMHLPPMDAIVREDTPPMTGQTFPPRTHSRKGSLSRMSPPVPQGRFMPRKESRDPQNLDTFLDLVENSHRRLDSQRARPKGAPRSRSPAQRHIPKPLNLRKTSLEEEMPTRGRTIEVKGSLGRSPSSPLPMAPQARLYREDIDQPDFPEEPEAPALTTVEPLSGRYFGDEDDGRGRGPIRDLKASHFRSPSSPAIMSADNRALYKADDDLSDFEDEIYYRRARTRATSRGRSPGRRGGSAFRRSPSPPPRGYGRSREREGSRPRRRPSNASRSRPRNDSMNRMHARPAQRGGIRRSRSERTLRQWGAQIDRAMESDRRGRRVESPQPSVQRDLSRGLPSNPKAWRSDLQNSRSNSPAASPSRGRSPAPIALSQATNDEKARQASNAGLPTSPASRNQSPVGRLANALRGRSSSRNADRSGNPKDTPKNNYYAPMIPDYESIASPVNLPEVPPLPSINRNASHARNNSEPTFKPLIRKLPPQPPPNSPPPLPDDLPVHPALQMSLEPSVPGKKEPRVIRRVKRSDELLTPVGDDDMDGWKDPWAAQRGGDEASIVVALDEGDEAGWERTVVAKEIHNMSRLGSEEMQKPVRHPSSESQGSFESIGSMNMI